MDAIHGKVGGFVIGIDRGQEIFHVAGNTFGGDVRKIVYVMALAAILNVVPQRKREEIVVDGIGVPIGIERVMAFQTVLRKPIGLVVGVLGGQVVVEVAADAFISNTVETQRGFRKVAIDTVEHTVRTNEWEAVFFVQFWDVIYQPRIGIVAAHAIVTNRHAVHIQMAANAIGFNFGKHQRSMTKFAIGCGMGTVQFKIGVAVVKLNVVHVDAPAIGIVALGTIDF